MSSRAQDKLGSEEGIFETFVSRDGALPMRLQHHCQRVDRGLARFQLPERDFIADLESFLPSLGPGVWRVRWTWLRSSSEAEFVAVALDSPPAEVTLSLGPEICRTRDSRATAKSVLREARERAHQAALQAGAWDALVTNELGEWVETTRANFILLRGRTLWTPAADSGLHPGTTRAAILERAPQWGWSIQEGPISADLWEKAEEWVVCNALVGVLPVRRFLASPRQWPGQNGAGAAVLQEMLVEGKDFVS